MKSKLHAALLGAVVIAYVGWAARFIARSAIETSSGRYFCLFDDAMVSLRYAWNLAHGEGLVWNPGERVEGVTSFLATIYMALGALVFDKSAAALFMQVTGLLLVVGVALLARQLGRQLGLPNPVALVIVPAVLAYYPLSYWSLMGMETGIVTAVALAALCVALRLGSEARGSKLLGLLLGLMFAARPDAIVPAAVILALRAVWILRAHGRRAAVEHWFGEFATLAGIVCALTLFRWLYFGSPVPNTYQLKMGDWPLLPRLHNGWKFIGPFFDTTHYLLVLALSAVVFHRDRGRLLLLCFVSAVIACQVWVGGDAWSYWRMLVPAVAVSIVLAVDGMKSLINGLARIEQPWIVAGLVGSCLSWVLWVTDQPFVDELLLEVPAYMVSLNRMTVPNAIELRGYADPRASVAVAAAGALPYYSGLRGVDILGKSDRYVARLRPYAGISVDRVSPGHSKYDLHYSIEKLRPDVIYDALAWARYQNGVFGFVTQNYVQVGSFWLRRDSQYVYWQKLPPH